MAKGKILIALTLLLLMIVPCSALVPTAFDVKIVTFVHDYGKYVPRWNNVFKPGETLKLYLGLGELNDNVGAIAIDFVVYVKDPNGFVVYKKVVEVRKLGYYDHVYEVLNVPIGEHWLSGKYTIEAYAFDVLNYQEVLKSYTRYNVFSGSGGGKIKTISRKDAPYVKKVLTFYVNPNADTTPPNRFVIANSRFESRVLPVNVQNKLEVTVFNNYPEDGKVKVALKVDGRIVDEKEVYLKGYEAKLVELTIPPLRKGTHVIGVVAFGDHVAYVNTPPIFVKPLLFDKPILLAKVCNGNIIYSPNDYVLGSVGACSINDVNVKQAISVFNETGFSLNKESAEMVMTNILAYAYINHVRYGTIKVALLRGSDERAKTVLPALLNYVKRVSKAPVEYVGVKGYDDLWNVNVLIYVGDDTPKIRDLGYFFERGGVLVIDNTDYWKDLRDSISTQAYTLANWSGLEFSDELYKSFYDFNPNKVVTIAVSTHVPPKFVYSDLTTSKFLVDVGKPVNISFVVKNIGGAGKERVEVTINGKVVYSEEVFLNKGESKRIEFSYVPKTEGSYKVQIVGTSLMKIFFAKGKGTVSASPPSPTPTPVQEKRRGAGLVVGSAALLAVLVIIRMLLRE